MSRAQNRRDAETSPGSVNPSSAASAALAARPMPVSSIPPHHTGMPRSRHRSWMRRAARYPPTRPALMLTISAAPRSMASAATVSDVIDSSRHTGVAMRPGQLGVPEQVVLGQRLLDQQQVELVEAGEVLGVLAGVGGVGVDLQRHVRADHPADLGDRLDVPARLDLQLDAHVAVVDVAGDGGQQLVDASRGSRR